MKRTILLAIVGLPVILFLSSIEASAQKPDRGIVAMAKEVSAKNIEATIRKLVSFGTRNTLSSQTDPNRGIGAARDWIFDEFQRISKNCGGCLILKKEVFTQPKGNRVPQPTE